MAFFIEETGECGERQLNHSAGEAERYYRDLQQRGIRVRVGLGYRIFALVRTAAGRAGFQGMDRGSGGDQGQASQEAED
jgi:hypothetical protein